MLQRIFSAIVLAMVCGSGTVALAQEGSATPLRDGWALQSSCKLQSPAGEQISSADYATRDWLKTKVPSTVLAAQVAAGSVKDPNYGTNLRDLPGVDYPVGKNFANLPMSSNSPYHCSWWYRNSFALPASARGKTMWLHFGGINYRANVWLNGKQIANADDIAGAYRTYELDVTGAAQPGRTNVLAVETVAPTETDLGINWVDWNPAPPDKNMGLWGPVDLLTSGPVTLRSPLVTTHFENNATDQASLTVYAELHNASRQTVRGVVQGTVAGVALRQPVELKAGENRTITFDPNTNPQLRVAHPRVWWPYQMGSPDLETARLAILIDGKISDERTERFGIREITSELNEKGFRLFRVNGKPILIRGAGWSQDMLLRQDPEYLKNELRLVRDMHLNTIRLEGKLESEAFFHLADEQGILVMLGWCCCDRWERWSEWTPENYKVAAESLRSQMYRVRNHPSLLVWLNGSDKAPIPEVEKAYLQIEKDTHWPNPILSSATQAPTPVSGATGVKMTGPYDYVAPSYWLADTKYGGAYGFNTETSPGPAIPTNDSLKKFIPEQAMWPAGDAWSLHNGGGEFKNLTVYNGALAATYGEASDVREYVRISQAMAYNGERAMFEAYGRNKYTSTGVIQWMLNNAWPSMIWHLFDYYLNTGGGYYGTKKACEPLHVQYSYDDRSVVVVNSTYQPMRHMTVQAVLYDQHMKELHRQQGDIPSTAPDSSSRIFAIPQSAFASDSPVYFLRLSLKAPSGEPVSENFYWLPHSATTFDWDKTDYTHTPAITEEDLRSLRQLPHAAITARARVNHEAGVVDVSLHNSSENLAFQVTLAARAQNGQEINPSIWSDNYVSLLPGETRRLTLELPGNALSSVHDIAVSAWNVPEQSIDLAAALPANRP